MSDERHHSLWESVLADPLTKTGPGPRASAPGTPTADMALIRLVHQGGSKPSGPASQSGEAPQDHQEDPTEDILWVNAYNRMVSSDWDTMFIGNYESASPSPNLDHPLDLGTVKRTTMAVFGPGVQPSVTADDRTLATIRGVSDNYHGNLHICRNYSRNDLPDQLNTSFWCSGFPSDVTVAEILGVIQHCGKIYSIHVNRGRATRYGCAACKLVFFSVSGATRFFDRYVSTRSFVVRGHRIYVVRNRVKVKEQEGLPANASRCILVTGQSSIVNNEYLLDFFMGHMKFQMDRIVAHFNIEFDCSTIEFRFGSYRAQASHAMALLTGNCLLNAAGVTAQYVRDPCDI